MDQNVARPGDAIDRKGDFCPSFRFKEVVYFQIDLTDEWVITPLPAIRLHCELGPSNVLAVGEADDDYPVEQPCPFPTQ